MESVDFENSEIDSFMDVIYAKLESMTKEDVIKRFVSVEFNRFLDYYKGAKDLNVQSRGDSRDDRGGRSERGKRDRDSGRGDSRGSREGRDRRDGRSKGRNERDGGRERESRGSRRNNADMQRFYVNIGSKHEANPGAIIGLINRATPDSSVDIGQIEVLKKFSFFEVETQQAKKVLDGINGLTFHDEKVVAEVSEKPKFQGVSKDKGRRKDTSKQRKSGGKKW